MDLNFQYAHHQSDESDTTHNISKEDALNAFEQFDWDGEVEKANQLNNCSPTLSILVNGSSEMIWVSGVGSHKCSAFTSECCFPGEVKRLFGLYKSQGTISLYSDCLNKAKAREAIELFLEKDYKGLEKLYRE
ncbi:hypothetical protein [uncultured Pseudoteredinibacter sp.]|uniref:hypothetical protein n=1 Tax=uncultured Pseudoteredinibacter sp. TaxID=1641701 RepID=UPI002610C376|nr:hypothetical protein [uncultured Pseudoteredinibacter sp.]